MWGELQPCKERQREQVSSSAPRNQQQTPQLESSILRFYFSFFKYAKDCLYTGVEFGCLVLVLFPPQLGGTVVSAVNF